MKTILIVEDDRALGDGLCLALKSPETVPFLCRTLSAARESLAEKTFGLLLLDVNLPDGNGLDFLRELRESSCSMPVILLTANDMETDIVVGLESGADDYVTKPFSLAVLRARVNAQLRRDVPAPEGPLEIEHFSFDFQRMEFRRDGRLVELSKTEQKLLHVLVENRGRTMTRAALVDRSVERPHILNREAMYVSHSLRSGGAERSPGTMGAASPAENAPAPGPDVRRGRPGKIPGQAF